MGDNANDARIIDGLIEEKIKLQLEQFIPGCFVCSKCGFGLVKSTMYMGSGNIGPTISNAVERCPNDNEVMAKETWRMRTENLCKVLDTQIQRAVDSETRNRQLVQAMVEAVKALEPMAVKPTLVQHALARLKREMGKE